VVSVPRTEVSISWRTLLFIAALVALGAAVVAVRNALLIVFIGIFVALVFERPTEWLVGRTRLGRGLAATILILGSTVLVAVVGLILLVPLVGAVRDFLHDLPDLVAQARNQDGVHWLGDTGGAENVQEGSQNLAATIPDSISSLLGVAGEAFSFFLAIFTIIFVALFLVADFARLRSSVESVLMPSAAARAVAVWDRVSFTISRWAIGAAVIAVIAGTVQGGAAALLGSSHGLALGVIAGLLDLIPNLGATIAGFILVPAVLAEAGPGKALIMLAVVLVYQQIENNLLTPKIQEKAVDLSAFWIIVSVSLLGALLGILGALVAVPLTASLQVVIRELTAERRARVADARGHPPIDAQTPVVDTGSNG
jgi:predicted PurR-regulated permease PerM